MSEVRFTPGQLKHLRRLKVRSFIADFGLSWGDSVRYGLSAYRQHRRMVGEYWDMGGHDQDGVQQFDGEDA